MKTVSLTAIPGDLGAAEAERIVSLAAGTRTAVVAKAERRVFYPYYWSIVEHGARHLLGDASIRVSCLVDARTEVTSTADRFSPRTLSAHPADVLEPVVDARRGGDLAKRYAGFVFRRGRARRRSLGALAATTLEATTARLVHKPFWIVQCHREGASFTVLVDGVTGRFHGLETLAS